MILRTEISAPSLVFTTRIRKPSFQSGGPRVVAWHCGSRVRCWSLALVMSLAPAVPGVAHGATGRVLILHTNDLHDHLRPGFEGQGGLPYVSGYIQQVRARRHDILLLDAGDVAEKGDLVAKKTHHLMTYEAMRRIGYDAVTIGNHDDDAGRDGLRLYEEALGQPLLCLNLIEQGGTPAFTPSRTFNIDALRVAVIGMIVPRSELCLDFEASGHALQREAERLDRDAHLVIALCHLGVRDCAEWSRLAPSVDVFVSGHSHERVPVPQIVPGTGARIVQAGSYANFVGRLDIKIDLNSEEILEAEGELVPMRHDVIAVDEVMLAWVRAKEEELCPEASQVVAHTREPLGVEIAWLAADALRRDAGADIAFCHPGQIIRSALPAGAVDINAIYLTGGDRGDSTLIVELTGAEIEAYLAELAARNDQTVWSGFAMQMEGYDRGPPVVETDLTRDRRYRVILPELEWRTRFLRSVDRARERGGDSPLLARTFSTQPSSVTYTESLSALVKELSAQGHELAAEATRLASEAYGQAAVR
ncbi:MAG: bifunctional metallophosphatase/5'-nucleotidase [Opitutaceae bacterium]